jgi:hypothetical protein
MPPQSFFVARGREKKTKKIINLDPLFLDICRKEVDNIWTVSRYCDDTGKSDEQIVKVAHEIHLIKIFISLFLGSLRLLCVY